MLKGQIMSMKKQVKSIVILGGGTSGWMSAAALSHHFQQSDVKITLVESSQLGTIGVGEATIPTLRRFYAKLGLSDLDVLKATAATCKLGIEFKNWYKKDTSFIHPFGIYGQGTREVGFHHYWLRQKQHQGAAPLEEYSLGVKLARENRFALPNEKPESQLEIFDWALHFDAALFADVMKDVSLKNKVDLIDNKVEHVKTCQQTGNIETLLFEDGQTLTGDLFIDCSGFKALLIEQALQTGYRDWSEWLFCDRAVAVQSESVEAPISRTVSTAHEAGWQWKIPLQHRQGNGHVYASQFIDDQQALDTLTNNVEGKLLHEPRQFSFTPGRRNKAWNKNCIAVGLSSGFLEPLESTSIALVETAINKIVDTFESGTFYTDDDVARFNEITVLEYERVRDFIILHYKATQRDDSPMWRACQEMTLPEPLKAKIEMYLTKGDVKQYPFEIFGKDSWLAIFDGFKLYPNTYDKRAENMPLDYLTKNLDYMKQRVQKSVDNAPMHSEFLKQYCHFVPNV